MSDSCHDKHQCSCCQSVGSVSQSLDELAFEKGIWSAAQCGDLQLVVKHLQKGIDVNVCDAAGYTALHYAARNGHVKICLYLLSNGAAINAITRSGMATALHRAATNGQLPIVKLLITNEANALLQDADGKTALHRAAESNHLEIYKMLLEFAPEASQMHDRRNNLPGDYLKE